ncbi:MAG: hypothetical protein M1504_01385 [Candidatus Marsarchaeota archaeon]|nr:hypothetical protein [Candidatus Marsarchaeota archaeon]
MMCDRCKKEVYKAELCNYCGKKICDSCVKSSQKATKLQRLVICRDCWSMMPKRKAFKAKQEPVRAVRL